MLDNQTLEQLRRLRLSGMAAAFAQQLNTRTAGSSGSCVCPIEDPLPLSSRNCS